jgi:hypothetical protein
MNDENTEFEDALTRALRPVNPPGRVARFLALAAEVEAERNRPRSGRTHRWAWFVPKPQRWAMGAVAALLAVGVFAGASQHQRHQREALATQQFEAASRITDQTLEHTREQLQRAGVALQ